MRFITMYFVFFLFYLINMYKVSKTLRKKFLNMKLTIQCLRNQQKNHLSHLNNVALKGKFGKIQPGSANFPVRKMDRDVRLW